MTRDDIVRMAREAGFRFSDEEGPLMANHAEWQRQLFERFFKLAYEAGAKDEREACARVCEARYMGDNNREDMEARRCAAAIRAQAADRLARHGIQLPDEDEEYGNPSF
jgi:hypothetical protein